MGITWLATHWFEFLQTTSILAGLFATVHTLRADIRERKIQNLFTITAAHRDLWMHFADRPALHRMLELERDLATHPPSVEEVRFVQELILHLHASYKARSNGMEFDDAALATDIEQFFARPLPRVVWESARAFQDREFVAFVERFFERVARTTKSPS